MNENELLKAKEIIQQAKDKKSRLEGQKESLMERLKSEFKCSTIKEAEELLEQKKEEKEEVENKINKRVDKLKENYPELFDDEY